jgi:hypothetical protein
MGSSGFRGRSGGGRRGAALLCAALAGGSISAPPPAFAQERWMAQEGQALAILPAPQGDTAIASASIVCDEQRWSFRLDLQVEEELETGEVSFVVDGSEFAAEAKPTAAGQLEIFVPFKAIEPLMRGLRVTLTCI